MPYGSRPTRPRKPAFKSRPPRATAPIRDAAADASADAAPVRLQKALAAAGLGSRRKCEELILTGRVEVDRQVVLELGSRVDAARQEIRVDGVPIKPQRHVYFLVNKPVGVVSTNRDQAGRPRVI